MEATTTLLLRQFYATMLEHCTEGAEDLLKRAEAKATCLPFCGRTKLRMDSAAVAAVIAVALGAAVVLGVYYRREID